MDLRMRRAERADFKAIWPATLQTVWDDIPEDERVRLEQPSWEKHFRKRISPYVDGERTESWIAEGPDGALLGYVIVGPGGGFLTPESYAFIYDVWIVSEQRGKGIGKELVAWAVGWAKDHGYRKIKLEVSEPNARARHVYEELGFRTERRYMGKALE